MADQPPAKVPPIFKGKTNQPKVEMRRDAIKRRLAKKSSAPKVPQKG